jgi:hypothetical protein
MCKSLSFDNKSSRDEKRMALKKLFAQLKIILPEYAD